jgi:hypothetical protein
MSRLLAILTVVVVLFFGTSARPDAPPAGSPTVRLLSAGSDPKSVMRLHVKKGDAQSMQMTMILKMRIGTTNNIELPPMRMGVSMSILDVSPNGDFRAKWTLDNVGVDSTAAMPSAQVDQLRALFAGMVGTNGHMVVTNRGFLRSADLEVAPSMDSKLRQMVESMKDSMGQMVSPLPEEPVGPGATWEVATDVAQGGMTIHQRTTNELLSRTGDTGKIKLTIAQTAGTQTITAPGLPPGTKADLNSMNGRGAGTNEFDLSKCVPTRAESKLTGEMSMTLQGRTVDMTTEVQVEVSSR